MDNNNNRGNYRGGNRRYNKTDPRVRVKRFDNGMNQPRNFRAPKRQTHLLARLKAQYGEDFLGIAHTAGEFSDNNRIRGFIRDLFSGNVFIEEFQREIMSPLLLQKMVERSRTEVRMAYVQAVAMDYFLPNIMLQAQALITPEEATTVRNDAVALYQVWSIINQSLEATLNSGMINALISGINMIRTLPSPAHGNCIARDYIRDEFKLNINNNNNHRGRNNNNNRPPRKNNNAEFANNDGGVFQQQ